jgi:hypothetical protein
VSERPLVSAHPPGGGGDAGAGEGQEQAASGRELAERVAEHVYRLLQQELRLGRERGSRRRGRWEKR